MIECFRLENYRTFKWRETKAGNLQNLNFTRCARHFRYLLLLNYVKQYLINLVTFKHFYITFILVSLNYLDEVLNKWIPINFPLHHKFYSRQRRTDTGFAWVRQEH